MTSADFIQMRLGAVRSALEHHVARGFAPGMVALVGRGEEAGVVSVGVKAVGSADPMRRDTLFRIASMTKPITAAGVMMLVEDGKLDLAAPVDGLLPELAGRRVLTSIGAALNDTVAAERPITFGDLMTFRFGLGAVMAPPDSYPIQRAIGRLRLVGFGPPDPASPFGPDEWMARLASLPLMAQPGEAWMYTTGSNVLGIAIARASGQSLPAFLRERIFAPLGMKDTGFYAPAAKHHRLAAAYRRTGGALKLFDAAPTSADGVPPAFPAGDSGLVSTVDDMFAFSRLLLRKGQPNDVRLLSDTSIAAMTTDHLTAHQRAGGAAILGPDHGWGYGLSVALKATPEGIPAGAYGWNGGLGTSWVADPGSEVTAILMTQTMFDSPDPPAVHKDFWRAVFSPAEA